jgi:portal protein
MRAHRLYGLSPVEQIALTVNIALRRDAMTLDYYRAGSAPDSFATLPKEWTMDQIGQFQDYFDALMAGNSSRRRMLKFMPADFRLQEVRQPPLKDQYDEWLARIVCYAFSVPVSPFVSAVNRATSETLRLQANQEGLIPLRAWIKNALDRVIQLYLGAPDLEFVWVGDDATDPLQQAQTLQILVSAGIKTKDEARAELGLAPMSGGGPEGLGKFNPYHDERGWFTTADGAVAGAPAARRDPDTSGKPNSDGSVSTRANDAVTVNFTPHPLATPNKDVQQSNLSCEALRESDFEICSSIAFADDHHYRKMCMLGMKTREEDCLAGRPLSPLLPY